MCKPCGHFRQPYSTFNDQLVMYAVFVGSIRAAKCNLHKCNLHTATKKYTMHRPFFFFFTLLSITRSQVQNSREPPMFVLLSSGNIFLSWSFTIRFSLISGHLLYFLRFSTSSKFTYRF